MTQDKKSQINMYYTSTRACLKESKKQITDNDQQIKAIQVNRDKYSMRLFKYLALPIQIFFRISDNRVAEWFQLATHLCSLLLLYPMPC